ncbi:sulfotransferase [Streptomyces sp. MI02-7b]|uniref:MmyB family transcriptional regulator n=1 Tax=Streptomyces sp. MI02-7b TaxID=462941 RepID=UPI0029B0E556|nr:sulfotransferase [Streptomyces sp. MI02-7b]MDX3075801.1 sulfotransferase [Streptomyces sp. MI02-7b]
MSSGAARREYQVLFRQYRRSLTRPDIGLKALPHAGNSRKPLRQADLDEALEGGAGVYQKFESGALVPSPAYVRRVATLLNFSEEDYYRAHQDLFPGIRPPYVLNPSDEVSSLWQRVVDGQASMSCVVKHGGDIAASNEAFKALFSRGELPSSMWRWLLLDSEARDHVLADWDTAWAPYLVSRLDVAATNGPYAPQLASLQAELESDDRLQKALRNAPEMPSAQEEAHRPFRHPVHGLGTAQLMTAHLDTAPGARLVTILFTSGPQGSLPRAPESGR